MIDFGDFARESPDSSDDESLPSSPRAEDPPAAATFPGPDLADLLSEELEGTASPTPPQQADLATTIDLTIEPPEVTGGSSRERVTRKGFNPMSYSTKSLNRASDVPREQWNKRSLASARIVRQIRNGKARRKKK